MRFETKKINKAVILTSYSLHLMPYVLFLKHYPLILLSFAKINLLIEI